MPVERSILIDRINNYTKEIDDLLYLLTCAVNTKKPDLSKVNNMNLDLIYEIASYHSVVSMIAFALESVIELPHKYDQAKKKAIRKLAYFDIERNKILSCFSRDNIWYMLLKGAVIIDYYPKHGMREMLDNDILCDPERMHDVKTIMENLGYCCKQYEQDNQDVYTNNILSFEIHRSLFDEDKYQDFDDYYKDIKAKLICKDNNPFEFRFRAEDLYIYSLVHEYKHYSNGGIGIRSLLDTYVFLKRHDEQLDWKYINDEINALSLSEFEQMNRELSQKVFSGGLPDNEEKECLMYFISSGTHGSVNHYMNNRILKRVSGNSGDKKRRYIFDRVFIRGEELKNKYPLVQRHKVLLPGLYVYRLSKAVFVNPKKTWTEYKVIKNVKSFKKEL